MSIHPFNVSIKLGSGKPTLPQREFSRHTADTVQVGYDIQGKNGERFVLVLERGADNDPAYVVILLDGVVVDHFFIDSSSQSARSQGWRKSATEVFTYLWAPRTSKTTDVNYFRVEKHTNANSLDTDLTGFITVHFYHIEASMQSELQPFQNFLKNYVRARHNKPLMDCYAIVSSVAAKSYSTPEKQRLPFKTWKYRMPVPFFTVSFRYNQSIRQFVGAQPFPDTQIPNFPTHVGLKRKTQDSSDSSDSMVAPHSAVNPSKRQTLKSQLHLKASMTCTASSSSQPCGHPTVHTGLVQKQSKVVGSSQGTSDKYVLELRGQVNATLVMIKDNSAKGDLKRVAQLTETLNRYKAKLDKVKNIDLTNELLDD